jgi:hypothetical protein
MDRWLTAYRQYKRTDEGELVAQDDHLMRATALLVLYGPDIAISENRASIEVDEDGAQVGWGFPSQNTGTGY